MRYEGAAQLVESHIGEPIERPDDLRRLAADALRRLDAAEEAIQKALDLMAAGNPVGAVRRLKAALQP